MVSYKKNPMSLQTSDF